ncbi:MAG: FHA domain-containing protein [Actinobacteria bacterium]|nr:FHA domain-containing protein [Actinomycetota bacterium]
MPVVVLTLVKILLLALLYVFLFRMVRTVALDLYGGGRKRSAPPPRPAVASAEQPKRTRKQPREIVVHPPNGRPQVVPLRDERVTLGRAGAATIVVEDVYVSDEHAEIIPEDGGWAVRDLGSTNGTFLNGAKVTQPTFLSSGDQLRLGKTRVEVRR